MDEPLRDMYGHKIMPVGEGFGVSVSLGTLGGGSERRVVAHLAVFHAGDGFRQALFSVDCDDRPNTGNVFSDRLQEVLSLLKEQVTVE